MTDTVWTSALAGVLHRGAVDVRSFRGVVPCRMRPLNTGCAASDRAHEPAMYGFVDQKATRDDSTTVGFHPPGRPQS